MRKSKKPKGAIDIQGCQVATEDHKTRQFLFTIQAQEQERVYYLQGDTEEDRAAWMQIIVGRSGVEKQNKTAHIARQSVAVR
jgi:hypothetical protein